MTLNQGDQLGPYEIEAPIGAGGMGEVFRARDTRLGREVAIKVLASMLAKDPDRLRRFEQEARAASLLNHPNILNVHDIGTQGEIPYVVYELLEGENLRSRMHSSSVSPKKAIDHALQVARGLAAAHEKGIVHRDLKPENLFITRDGHIKILDFGLAKLTQPLDSGSASNLQTAAGTEAGVIMGTVGYMSPEQVRGQTVDHRSDIFSFGAILYEMLSGQRAFQGDSTVETMNAILKTDPPEVRISSGATPPAVDRVVKHCLEKNPDDRFQSAHDLAFALETLSSISSSELPQQTTITSAPRRISSTLLFLLALPLLLIGLAAGYWLTKKKVPEVQVQRLTFQPGTIYSGQFGPDGKSIFYGASWNGKPTKVYQVQPGIPESSTINLPDAEVVSVSAAGELLLLLKRRFIQGYVTSATLARAPVAGGTPREIMENVQAADWHPTTGEIAVAHEFRVVDYPAGKKFYETKNWISSLRFSPDGKTIALVEHTTFGDNAGFISVLDEKGNSRALTKTFGAILGIAWHPQKNELWYTATTGGARLQLQAITMDGKNRIVHSIPGSVLMHDISDQGDVLVSVSSSRRGISALPPGETLERDLSWFDWSFVTDITPDGKKILFMEQGEGSGQNYGIYIRDTDGSPAVKLGEGWSTQLSPDGTQVVLISYPQNDQISLIPTGTGHPTKIERHSIVNYEWVTFLGHKKVLFVGSEKSVPQGFYVQDIPAGKPQLITKDIANIQWAVSPDETRAIALSEEGKAIIYSTNGRSSEIIPEVVNMLPIKWTDEDVVYFAHQSDVPARVYQFNLKTRKLTLWKELAPPDIAGVQSVGLVVIAPKVSSYAYSYRRILSDLYLFKDLN